MKIAISSDHAGKELRSRIVEYLKEEHHDVEDLGTFEDKANYVTEGLKTAESVAYDENDFGIIICGSGIGMSLAANKHKGIRAALCHDYYTAAMARRHNYANILCFGARIVGKGEVMVYEKNLAIRLNEVLDSNAILYYLSKEGLWLDF